MNIKKFKNKNNIGRYRERRNVERDRKQATLSNYTNKEGK